MTPLYLLLHYALTEQAQVRARRDAATDCDGGYLATQRLEQLAKNITSIRARIERDGDPVQVTLRRPMLGLPAEVAGGMVLAIAPPRHEDDLAVVIVLLDNGDPVRVRPDQVNSI